MVDAADTASATNNDCVRIKGANSDYTFDIGKGQIVENKAVDPLFLKIFICPNKMPSRIEKPHNGKWCEGMDQQCPQPDKPGHALISLHQTEGISLVSQKGITAQGPFQVQSAGTQLAGSKPIFEAKAAGVTLSVPLVMQPTGKDPVLQVTESERTIMAPVVVNAQTKARLLEINDAGCTVTAPVMLQSRPSDGLQISVSQQEIVLKTPEGAIIQLKGNAIEITPGRTGTVKINGTLEVTGEITVAGKKVQTS